MDRFMHLKDEINSYLEDYFSSAEGLNKLIYESMGYSLKVGGKRIRPILTILTYQLFKKEGYKEIIPFAAAIEMIHTYSLIHDDLPCMDNDDLRRGRPTNHKVFGEAIAVLAGDALLNEAFNVMIDYSMRKGKQGLKAMEVVGRASGCQGMIGGQVVDILSENSKVTAEVLNYIHDKKTAALITAAVVAGAELAGAPKEDIEVLERYGRNLGLAFQIKDDILDVEGDSTVLGKAINSDISNNKFTYVNLLGLNRCKEKCIELTRSCVEELTSLGYSTEDLLELTKYLLERNY